MDWKIKPKIGFNTIKFGLSRNNVRIKFKGFAISEFYRTEQSIAPVDAIDELGLFIYYNEKDECEAIEFFEPAAPIFNKKNLLKISYMELISLFKEMDDEINIESDGFTSSKFGIGSYAPNAEEDMELPCESIIIFQEGYYE